MRTFFGLDLDAGSKLAIESWRAKALPGLSGAVPPENFHITLAFLGDIKAMDIEALANIEISPFQLNLHVSEVGYFSKSGIGFLVIEPTSELLTLREKLLADIPVRLRRQDHSNFVPHITLFRNLKTPLPAPLLEPGFGFSFQHIHLFESVKKSRKTRYKPIITYN